METRKKVPDVEAMEATIQSVKAAKGARRKEERKGAIGAGGNNRTGNHNRAMSS